MAQYLLELVQESPALDEEYVKLKIAYECECAYV